MNKLSFSVVLVSLFLAFSLASVAGTKKKKKSVKKGVSQSRTHKPHRAQSGAHKKRVFKKKSVVTDDSTDE